MRGSVSSPGAPVGAPFFTLTKGRAGFQRHFGNGITNMLTPTSGTLLAYLATANVGWPQWARFMAPLWAVFIVRALIMLAFAVLVGY